MTGDRVYWSNNSDPADCGSDEDFKKSMQEMFEATSFTPPDMSYFEDSWSRMGYTKRQMVMDGKEHSDWPWGPPSKEFREKVGRYIAVKYGYWRWATEKEE